ncbi:MAG: hypothetical protein A2W99_13150 [Bacteroidetes bacterium GWF2_33_16]|nr:MAG: hypothetical protein A2X00_01125 [Bacteroidetes bacterium GWE2_32_14]OFY06626.1 MAG: hypothetical protein A2W99_13150 [Bacteroidetes bacterium GWF2_33_16]
MIAEKVFNYKPNEHEAEKASNSYLMSIIALMGGLPFPIINLVATIAFYFGNRKSPYFVRWHCTQALISQFSLFIMNTAGFWWTISILFGSEVISNNYVSYILTLFLFNIGEFIGTVYTAINTRKGIHIEWWFFGNLTNLICKE